VLGPGDQLLCAAHVLLDRLNLGIERVNVAIEAQVGEPQLAQLDAGAGRALAIGAGERAAEARLRGWPTTIRTLRPAGRASGGALVSVSAPAGSGATILILTCCSALLCEELLRGGGGSRCIVGRGGGYSAGRSAAPAGCSCRSSTGWPR
jgi:hypothetical protein